MARYTVTTLFKDGSKHINQFNNRDYAIQLFTCGVECDNIVKSVRVYDSVERSVILDSKKYVAQ